MKFSIAAALAVGLVISVAAQDAAAERGANCETTIKVTNTTKKKIFVRELEYKFKGDAGWRGTTGEGSKHIGSGQTKTWRRRFNSAAGPLRFRVRYSGVKKDFDELNVFDGVKFDSSKTFRSCDERHTVRVD